MKTVDRVLCGFSRATGILEKYVAADFFLMSFLNAVNPTNKIPFTGIVVRAAADISRGYLTKPKLSA